MKPNETTPFTITAFPNRSGTQSFRVQGYFEGKRIRKNFADRASAEKFCNDRNAQAVDAAYHSHWTVVQTLLTEKQVRLVEATLAQTQHKLDLRDILDLGAKAVANRKHPEPLGRLYCQWLELIEHEVSPRWYRDMKVRVGRFVREHPKLTTTDLSRRTVREWLDRMNCSQQTKINMRTAFHRFGRWLVEREYVEENPASDIKISRRRTGAAFGDQTPPSVFTPRQAEALLRACELGACRPMLGWMAACLFMGLRPESEAPRATWSEINWASGEWSVMGRKRGARPRIIRMTETALAWMRVVLADRVERPARFSRPMRLRAQTLANNWLLTKYPSEEPIRWDEDITRHTFASFRSPQIAVHDLAAEMGNSPATIYAHYRHPQPAADVQAFWALRPAQA